MNLKTIRDVDVQGKRVLVRVDYNVSIGAGLQVVDDTRIKHTIPTIEYLLEHDCCVFLVSHFGRPKGKFDKKYSLAPIAKHLERLMGKKVVFVADYIGEKGEKIVAGCTKGQVYLLENTRFHPGEEKNDREFARELAKFGDIFVNDAFGTAHRTHASTVGVAEFLPSIAGLSLRYETETILNAIENPKRPLVVIVGGVKVSDKMGMLRKLIAKADYILIGGGMANTFLCAKGYEMGNSYCELDKVNMAKELLVITENSSTAVLLPEDLIVGSRESGQHNGPFDLDKIPQDQQALDIGPKTQARYGKVISEAGTIVWNGPMGVFEKPQFAVGTDFIFHMLTQNEPAMVIVGGGDTLAAISKQEHLDRIDHISTGGGAMLELIENGTLPGIDILETK